MNDMTAISMGKLISYEYLLVRVVFQDLLKLIIIQLGIAVGNTHEQPAETLELVVGHILHELSPPEGSVWGNARSSGHHDEDRVLILWHQQHLASWTCNRGAKDSC